MAALGVFAAGTICALAATAEDLVIPIDLSDASTYELVQPLRRDCAALPANAKGSDDSAQREEAKALETSCLRRRLLAGAELDRVIRTYFPSDLTPRELAFCVEEVEDGEPLLPCAIFWAREEVDGGLDSMKAIWADRRSNARP